jgi:hypothetical protein
MPCYIRQSAKERFVKLRDFLDANNCSYNVFKGGIHYSEITISFELYHMLHTEYKITIDTLYDFIKESDGWGLTIGNYDVMHTVRYVD